MSTEAPTGTVPKILLPTLFVKVYSLLEVAAELKMLCSSARAACLCEDALDWELKPQNQRALPMVLKPHPWSPSYPSLKILSKLASATYLSAVCRPALFVETLLTADAVWWLWEALKILKSALEDLEKLIKMNKITIYWSSISTCSLGLKRRVSCCAKPPKLLELLDCPHASKFAKSAFLEFWAAWLLKWAKLANLVVAINWGAGVANTSEPRPLKRSHTSFHAAVLESNLQ